MENIWQFNDDKKYHLVYDDENSLCGKNITDGAVKGTEISILSCKKCAKAVKVALKYAKEYKLALPEKYLTSIDQDKQPRVMQKFICIAKAGNRALYYSTKVGKDRVYRSGYPIADNKNFKLFEYRTEEKANALCHIINLAYNDNFHPFELVRKNF